MPIIIRAFLTGLGYKLGAEVGRVISDRLRSRRAAKEDEAGDDVPPADPEKVDAD
jgi:hypothetical protein